MDVIFCQFRSEGYGFGIRRRRPYNFAVKNHYCANRTPHCLELSGDLMSYRPVAKRALLGPFSDEAGFTSSAILRPRLHRILFSRLSMPCDSRLWSRSLHLCWGFCKLSGRVVCVCLQVFRCSCFGPRFVDPEG